MVNIVQNNYQFNLIRQRLKVIGQKYYFDDVHTSVRSLRIVKYVLRRSLRDEGIKLNLVSIKKLANLLIYFENKQSFSIKKVNEIVEYVNEDKKLNEFLNIHWEKRVSTLRPINIFTCPKKFYGFLSKQFDSSLVVFFQSFVIRFVRWIV